MELFAIIKVLVYGGDFLDQDLWYGNEKNVEHFNLGGFKNLFR